MDTHYQCRVDTIKVDDFIKLHNNGTLIKAKIQRKKRWLDLSPKDKKSKDKHKANNQDFINFIIKTGNIINPVLLVDRIDDNKVKHIIIDGNNRINAIIDFLTKPLKYMEDIIPTHKFYKNELINRLRQHTLMQLSEYTCLEDFCDEINEQMLYKKIKNNYDVDDIEGQFKHMLKKLKSLKFFDIKVLIITFIDVSEKIIKEIYEGVNCGGVKLTRQEILASTTSLIKYDETEIPMYYSKITKEVDDYYNDMDKNENITIDRYKNLQVLNLFEVLIGFQNYCSTEYSFINNVGENETLDVIFKCYEVVFKNFDYKNNVNSFFDNFIKACDIIKNIANDFYNMKVVQSPTSTFKINLKTSAFTILFCYIYKKLGVMNESSLLMSCKKILLYNEICSMITDKEHKVFCETKNDLGYLCSMNGVYLTEGINILNGKKEIRVPQSKMIQDILTVLNYQHLKEYSEKNKPKSRAKLSKFKVLILCLYYNQYFTTDDKNKKRTVEHIVPWCIKQWKDEIDIDRLGNIYIDDNPHKTREDEFHEMHRLSNMDVASLNINLHAKTLENTVAYNEICQRRERDYIKYITQSLNQTTCITSNKSNDNTLMQQTIPNMFKT